jgi:hypothetical protein
VAEGTEESVQMCRYAVSLLGGGVLNVRRNCTGRSRTLQMDAFLRAFSRSLKESWGALGADGPELHSTQVTVATVRQERDNSAVINLRSNLKGHRDGSAA